MSDTPVMGHVSYSPDFKSPSVNPLITTASTPDVERFKAWLTRSGQPFDERKHDVGTQVVVEDLEGGVLISVLFHSDGRFRKLLAGLL